MTPNGIPPAPPPPSMPPQGQPQRGQPEPDFTDEQWALLMDGPQIMALAVALVDGGAVGFGRELYALTTFVEKAREAYPNNALINAALDATPLEDDLKESKYLDAGTYNSIVFLELMQKINSVLRTDLLEHYQYKVMLLHLGQHIAKAAGTGMFGRGEKVSQDEINFLVRAQQLFGVG